MTLDDFHRTIPMVVDNENGGQMRMLRALAGTRKDSLSRREIGALADVKSTGGTFGTYLSRLRGEGLIESRGEGFRITAAGRAKVGHVEQPTGRALLEWWKPKLGDKPARMLETLVDAPEPLTRDYLAESCGLAGNAGTFGTYLSRLISRGLVERAGRGMFRAADVFRE
jgi:DNA-binding transcriptional ArsR family regulator